MDNRKQQSSRARERRLRAKYRRNLRFAVVFCLIIGLAGGFVLGQYAPQRLFLDRASSGELRPSPTPMSLSLIYPTDEPTIAPTDEPTTAPTVEPTTAPTVEPTTAPTDEPTTAPTVEPTEAPTVEPTIAPTVEPTEAPTATPEPVPTATPEPDVIIVPYGETQALQAQINNDGSVRKDASTLTYETLTFNLSVSRYLTPEYYQQTYATRYQMQGDEAGVEFQMMLVDYMGSQTIAPQDLMDVRLETASGTVEQGYQLTDAEIQGARVVLETNIPTTAYKRFRFSNSVGDMKYLSVTTIVDGVSQKYLFELGEPVRPTPEPTAVPAPATPTPEPTPEPKYEKLEIASKGDAVKQLQQKLIDLGYLEGTADGRYGEMTAKAVKAAQAAFGMEITGTADKEFQKRLYSEN